MSNSKTLKKQIELVKKANKVSRTFSMLIKGSMTADELKEVIRRNDADTDPACCHSHDFVDANMLMDEAFKANNINLDINSDDHICIWSDAWLIAKENDFFTKQTNNQTTDQ